MSDEVENNMLFEECICCYRYLGNTPAMGCGHRVHLACLEKHFKPECPICKRYQNLVIPKGQLPKTSPGRTILWVNPESMNQKIVINGNKIDDNDKIILEKYLTRKHRGEKLNKTENNECKNILNKIGNVTLTIEKNF